MLAHTPVLLAEVIQFLEPRPRNRFIDATLGGGGHTRAILE
ncbi:MAG TPA: 16S rRNA (cytosine(1402)-N(4))-methyltransferase, partial [Terriglobia bacterium]|nr:16S rRNA (cytosine(1402)-N(4))-methyltransferase [Terriglobia bacterium]